MNRLDLLKTLLPGFLPLLVYILADSIFGEKIGLLIAIVFGIAEFIYGYLKEKMVDSFLLIDIGLITLLGMMSIFLNTPLLFKIKPAIIEILLVFLLVYALNSPKNILSKMMSRYSRNAVQLPDSVQLKKMITPLIGILCLHAVLTLIAAIWMSKAVWGFVSGGLFYLFFLAYLGWRWLSRKMSRNRWVSKYKDDEWFDVVDTQGRPLFKAPRTICHQDPTLLHAVVHLHVFNKQKQLYLQKRPGNKQVQPDKWDTAVGGHVHSGEKVLDALVRESMEEINLDIRKAKVFTLGHYIWKNENESELVFVFYCQTSQKPQPNLDEIDEGKFWSARSIRDKMEQNIFTPNFLYEFEGLIKPLFDQAIPHQ